MVQLQVLALGHYREMAWLPFQKISVNRGLVNPGGCMGAVYLALGDKQICAHLGPYWGLTFHSMRDVTDE